MGATKSKRRASQLAFFDGSTFETVEPLSPVYLYDDFLGYDVAKTDGQFFNLGSTADSLWTIAATGVGGPATVKKALSNVTLHLEADDETEDAGIYCDTLSFNIDKGPIFEARIDVAVLPTDAQVEIHIGFQGEAHVADDQIASGDNIDYHIFFAIIGATDDYVIYTDDHSVGGHNTAVATGVSAVPGTYNILRIDCTDASDVKFYIDGVGVATGTTFNLSNGTMTLMPNIMVTKASGAGLCDVKVDYVRVWQATR
jgi:hypothetical protein